MNRRILIPYLAVLLSVPVFAEVDLSGNWAARQHQDWQERGPGPEPVDYSGLPINAEGRAKALKYQASILSLPERQCLYYTPAYLVIGPFPIKMWAESDPTTGRTLAWKVGGLIDRAILTIWMDGRPHPPEYAPHTNSGFTTGEWEGDVLTTYTTHFKAGYIRRNGTPSSDQASMIAQFIRHDEFLTVTQFVEDPVYLTEPYVLSRVWQLDPHANLSPVPAPCTPEAEVARLDGQSPIPHFLPGTTEHLKDAAGWIPVEATRGGAETTYPDYRQKLKQAAK